MSPAFHSNLESTNFWAQGLGLFHLSDRLPVRLNWLKKKGRYERRRRRREGDILSAAAVRPKCSSSFALFPTGVSGKLGRSVGRSVLLSFSDSTVSFMNNQWKAQGKPCQPFGSKAATVLVMKAEIFWFQWQNKCCPITSRPWLT